MKKQIAVIDCAIKQSSIHCFNRLLQYFDCSLSYHRPPEQGMRSLYSSQDQDQAYIIFGSASNIEDQLQWHAQLASFCHEQLLQSKPIFAICFGHQLMAHYYGATIDKNNEAITYKGSREITFIESFSPFSKGKSFQIFSAHSFEVKTLPEDMIHIASSEECLYDGLAHKSLPLISFQGHPEASPFFVEQEIRDTKPDFPIIDNPAFKDGIYLLTQWFEKSLQ